MKPSVLNDARTRRLATLLGGDFTRAWGLLFGTWHFAAEHAPDGFIPSTLYDHLAGFLFYREAADPIAFLTTSGWAVARQDPPRSSGVDLQDWQNVMPGHLANSMRQQKKREVPFVARQDPPRYPLSRDTSPNGRGGVGGGVGAFKTGAHSEETHTQDAFALQAQPAKPKKTPRVPPPQVQASDLDLPESLNTPAVYAALVDWIAHRKRIGKRINSRPHLEAALKKDFDTRPDALIAAVAHSITSGYQGLFEPNSSRDTKKPTGQLSAAALENIDEFIEEQNRDRA